MTLEQQINREEQLFCMLYGDDELREKCEIKLGELYRYYMIENSLKELELCPG